MTLGTIQIIGLVIVIGLAIFAGVMICLKSKKNDLVKWLGLFILLALALTWIFGYGYYEGATFQDYGMNQQGLSDIPNFFYYAINFAGDKITFLLALGIFYGVVSKTKSYRKLVQSIAKKIKGKEIVFVLLVSLLFTVLSTFLIENFAPLIFVPFVISILLEAKLDRMSAFCATFGSMLIGILGEMYGGEGLVYFNQYVNVTISEGLLERAIVLVIAFIVFNFLTIMHVKKVLSNNHAEEEIDPYVTEKITDKEKTHTWPMIALFAIIFIIVILGYVSWGDSFGIKFFAELHQKIMNFTLQDLPWIGKHLKGNVATFAPVSVVMGSLFSKAYFGAWTLFNGATMLLLATVLVGLCSKTKLTDWITNAGEGIKSILLPIALFIGTYMVMVAAYMSPFVPTINNLIASHMSKFNPYITSVCAFIANTFHVDFGYTGYSVARYFTVTYPQNLNVIHTIYTTLYGLASFCVPTSGILVIGLSYLKIEYKSWIKYSWIFILGMLLVLIALFTILTYV